MQRVHRLVLSAVLILGAGSSSRAQFFDWVFPLGTVSSTQTVSDVTLDAVGNVYLAGSFTDTVDFDPGPGAFALGATSLDAFVAKYTKDAELFWAVRFGGLPDARVWTTGMGVDLAGNVYVVGQFEG